MLNLRRVAELSSAERRLVVTAWPVLVLARLALSVIPFSILRRLAVRGATAPAGVRRRATPEALARAVARASRLVPRATCLTQALALRTLLHREGYASQLRLGVTREAGRLTAHAWLESDGTILIGGGALDRFSAFPAREVFS